MPIPLLIPLIMSLAGKGMASSKENANETAMEKYQRELDLEAKREAQRQERAQRLSGVLKIMGYNVDVPTHQVGGGPRRPDLQSTKAEEGLASAGGALMSLYGGQQMQGAGNIMSQAGPAASGLPWGKQGSYDNPMAGGAGVKSPGLWYKTNPAAPAGINEENYLQYPNYS